MDSSSARDGLFSIGMGVGFLLAAVVLFVGIGFHMVISVGMTEIKHCRVGSYGWFQFLWMIALVAPLLLYLCLRGFVWEEGLMPFLAAGLLLAGIYGIDIWFAVASDGIGLQRAAKFNASGFCSFMRSILPRA